MQGDPQELIGQLGPLFLLIFGVIALAGYVVFAVLLSVIARKTNTPNAWMAWIPILSAVLLCRIGRRSPWLILLLIVPLINLAVLIYIFMGVCEARGKPPIAALLMLVPIVSFFVLVWLASGPATTGTPAQPVAYTPAAAAGQPLSSATLNCQRCGDPLQAKELFCSNCGAPRPAAAVSSQAPVQTPQPAVAVPAVRPQPSPGGSGAKIAILGAVVLLIVAGWIGISSLMKPAASGGNSSDTAAASGLPERTSGVLAEFPVDTERQTPAKPVSMSTVRLHSASRIDPPKGLPPGLTTAILGEVTESVSSASYSTSPNESPVDIHVIDSDKPAAEERITRAIIDGGSGAASDVSVQVTSPIGQVYRGRKIRTVLGSLVYVLKKEGAGMIIVIHATNSGAFPLADRLAANIGNGRGIFDYMQMAGAVISLPPVTAGLGMSLEEMKTYPATDLVNVNEFRKTLGTEAESIRRFVPGRLTALRYSDASRREWKVLTGDYGSSMKSWITWSALRFLSGLSGMQPVSAGGMDGLTMVQNEERILVLRNGSAMTIVTAPGSEAIDRVTAFARQVAR